MNKFLKKLSFFVAKTIIVILILTILWVVLYRFVNPPVTPLMLIRYFENESSIDKEWLNYDQISDYVKLAVIAAEDQKFPYHKGFDLESIQDAIVDKLEGKELRGASTISQQVAKNVFLWPSRSWLRKGSEAYFTFLIETLWSKERILEVYLNVVETGDGIYGVGTASKRYFGRDVMFLPTREAALLAAILPNPISINIKNPSEYARQRQIWIIRQMNNLGTSYINKIE